MINIIVAVAQNGVIGHNGRLPWKLPKDMARFKELTMEGVVIFGKKTFEEFGKPLTGRENIVLSKSTRHIDGVKVFGGLDTALEYAKTLDKEIFICGGESVYKEAMDIADRLYITYIHKSFDGDRHFPSVPDCFKCISTQKIQDNGIETEFKVYIRIA